MRPAESSEESTIIQIANLQQLKLSIKYINIQMRKILMLHDSVISLKYERKICSYVRQSEP